MLCEFPHAKLGAAVVEAPRRAQEANPAGFSEPGRQARPFRREQALTRRTERDLHLLQISSRTVEQGHSRIETCRLTRKLNAAEVEPEFETRKFGRVIAEGGRYIRPRPVEPGAPQKPAFEK